MYIKIFGDEQSFTINDYRINKLIEKGYSVNYNNPIMPSTMKWFINKSPTHNDSIICTLCKKSFTDDEKAFNLSSTSYIKLHIDCFTKILTNPKPHTDIDTSNCPCELVNFILKLKTFYYDK